MIDESLLNITADEGAALAFFGQCGDHLLLAPEDVDEWIASLNEGDARDAVLVLAHREEAINVSLRAVAFVDAARRWAAQQKRPLLQPTVHN